MVRIPRALQQRQSGRRSSPRLVLARPGPLLISARRRELSQPARLTLGRWERAPLASRGWKNRRSRRDHFSIERAQHEVPALRNLSSEGSFADLGLEPPVLRALKDAAPEVLRPTTVQSSTIPLYFAAATSFAPRKRAVARLSDTYYPCFSGSWAGQA